jgi:hypothetical protein
VPAMVVHLHVRRMDAIVGVESRESVYTYDAQDRPAATDRSGL